MQRVPRAGAAPRASSFRAKNGAGCDWISEQKFARTHSTLSFELNLAQQDSTAPGRHEDPMFVRACHMPRLADTSGMLNT
jgi:hypothetical protein